MYFLRRIVNFFIDPLNRLAWQTRHIADGNFDVSMPTSTRVDAVGRLQNNFADMQQSLFKYISNLEHVNKESPAHRDHIFNQFIKANSFSEGLGLGLYVSKQFAKMMGGDLTLDESYTLGARFILAVPA